MACGSDQTKSVPSDCLSPDSVIDLRTFDLNLVVVLCSLLRHHSITDAANSLGLSAPAISRALGRLRERFDDELLTKHGRSFQPTPLGAQLALKLETLVEDMAAIFMNQIPVPQQFSVGMPDYLALVLTAPLSGYFRQISPTTLFVPAISPNNALRLLEDGKLDLALGIIDSSPLGFRCRSLPPIRSLYLARRGHAAARQSLSQTELERFPSVRLDSPGQNGNDGMVDGLAAIQLQGNDIVSVPNIHTAAQVVHDSDAILVLPAPCAEYFASSYDLEAFTPVDAPLPSEYRVSLIWHERWQKDAIHAGVRSLIASRIMEGPRERVC